MKAMFGTIAASLLLTACVYPPESDGALPAMPSLAKRHDNPQLALMDHVLAEYFTSDIANRPTACAAVLDGREEVALPPEDERELIARYEALAPFSRCGLIDGTWQDTETGEPAMVFTLHSFSCPDADHCTAFGGYIAGGVSSMSYRYEMTFEDDAWSITRDRNLLAE